MDQTAELIGFLADPKPEVQAIALEHVLPLTVSSANKSFYFKENDYAGVKQLKKLAVRPPTVRGAVTALVNLSEDANVRSILSSDAKFVKKLAELAVAPEQVENAALLSMLLNNLAHDNDAVETLLEDDGALIRPLASKLEEDTTSAYDYFALLCGEIARTPNGAKYWCGPDLPLAPLIPQLLMSSIVRRTGIAATIKNILFDVGLQEQVIRAGAIEYIMLALKGPETLDDEDTSKLPPIVQEEMGPDKKREDVSDQQLLLLECLILLGSTKVGRAALRERHAYFIVRELHLAVKTEAVLEACERYVNLVMRGEPEDAQKPPAGKEDKITEIKDDDSDEEITEVV